MTPRYLVTFDGIFADGFGRRRRKTGIHERDFDDMGRAATVRMIADSQFPDIDRVLEWIDGEPLRDVTEELAEAVYAACEGPARHRLLAWLQAHGAVSLHAMAAE